MATYGNHLYRRNGHFYARLRIPQALEGAYGRSHLRTSPDTNDHAEAWEHTDRNCQATGHRRCECVPNSSWQSPSSKQPDRLHRCYILTMEHLAKVNVPLYIRNKRAVKDNRRKHRVWRAQQRSEKEKAAIEAEFGDQSKILLMMGAGYPPASPADIRKGRARFVAPEIFSMMDNPSGTISALAEFAMKLSMPRLRSVRIDLNKVKTYDLGANALLDILVEEVTVKARQTRRKIHWRGSYPADDDQRRLVRSLGVIKFLELAHEYNSQDESSLVEAFHDRAKHYVRAVRANETDRKSRVTQRFADHINKCLGHINRQLQPAARKKLCDYVGEILDNAEEHAGMFDWTIQGYLDTSTTDLICEIAIFNFGQTIAGSLSALDQNSYTRKKVQPYLDAHSNSGIFSTGWKVDDLLTLIALQGSVSSKNFSDLDTRGNGTVDLITFFQKVTDECRTQPGGKKGARMTLVSGSTGILFDGKYEMIKLEDRPGIIAFNSQNDLLIRPDPDYVKHLSGAPFPGTVLSIKFPLSPDSSTSAVSGE